MIEVIKKISKFAGSIILAHYGLLASNADSIPIRIMPLGDSITTGCCSGTSVQGGYRNKLYSLLTAAGYSVDFVGTQRDLDNPALPDRDHQGMEGYQIAQIQTGLSSWFADIDDPDVILLMIGTNDFWAMNQVESAQTRLTNLVADMAMKRPFAKIILSNLPLRTDSANTEALQVDFNTSVQEIVVNQVSLGRQVSFVDMHSAWLPSDLSGDHVHPNLVGYDKMADVWSPAIQSVITPLGTSNPPATVSVNPPIDRQHITVNFSKPLADTAANLANFSLSGGLTISQAVLDPVTKRSISFTTSAQTAGTLYTLAISGVLDRTPQQNQIASGSSVSFSAAVPAPAPTNHWTFNGNVGAVTAGTAFIDDASGMIATLRGNGATLTGTSLTLPGNTTGNQSAATISAYLDLPNGLLSAQPSITVEAWATPLSSKPFQRLFDFGRTNLTSGSGAVAGEIVDGAAAPGNFACQDDIALSLNVGDNLGTYRLEGRINSGNVGATDSLATTTAGTQYHYTLTVQDSAGVYGSAGCQAKWYRNGILQNTLDLGFHLAGIDDVNNWVGRSLWADDSNSNISLDELRIYTHALSPGEVFASYMAGTDTTVSPPVVVPPPVPTNRWTFNGGGSAAASGRTFTDVASGKIATLRGSGATLTGTSLSLPGNTTGNQSAAEISAYLDLPNGLLSAQPSISIEAWVTPLSSKPYQRLFDFGRTNLTRGSGAAAGEIVDGAAAPGNFASQDGLALSLNVGASLGTYRLEGRINSGTIVATDSSATTTTGTQYHYVLTVQDSVGAYGAAGCQAKWYRNGILQNWMDLAFHLAAMADVNNWIGRSQWADDSNSNISLDELRIYTHALSSGEVTASYTAGTVAAVPPPVAVGDAYSTDEEAQLAVSAAQGLLHNDTDPNSLPLSVGLDVGPAHGSLILNANGSFTYMPSVDFSGTDSFTYHTANNTEFSGVASVTITVNPVNDAPVVSAQSATVDEDGTVGITLIGSDVDGDLLTYVVGSVTHGQLSGTAPNLTYTPAANYNGQDSFTFKARDGTADSNVATVAITVNPVNDAPVASAQSVVVDEDGAIAMALLASDLEGSPLTFTVGSPSHGLLTGTAPNLTYTPAANYNGQDSFTFKAGDGTADSNVATVAITVNPVNDPPVASAQTVMVDEDASVAITLIGSDVDGNSLTYGLGSVTHGQLTGIAPNLTYTPAANYNGQDNFTFFVNDGTTNSTPATFAITVNPVNDAPVAAAQSVVVDEDGAVAITLAASDLEGSPLTFAVGSASHGLLTGAAPNLTYTPDANYNGPDSFTFKVGEGAADSNVATVAITVNPVNDAPVAAAQSVTVDEDASVAITLNGNDVDGNSLTYVVSSASHGQLSGTAPNLTYTPAANYDGQDSFTFFVNDGTTNSSPVTVLITVNPVNRFNQWLSSFGLVAKPESDSDGDSISNAVEYVIGGNSANKSDSSLLPNVSILTADPDGNLSNDDYLLFSYHRTHMAQDDPNTSIEVEWSTDIAGPWMNTNGTVGVVTVVENDAVVASGIANVGVDLVKVYIPRSLSSTGRLFARLGVNIKTP